ncbi:hypothetical protein RSJ68_03785 [Neisseria sp. DTU_2020_1000833_1_SI_GRL_NUU_006]|jgi:hypothetical protein|nr:hypothetical protein RSJ68_03785 [Neisseria sp. DTU_2020_1000833_1_SI_GRL_NUU_006]
MGFVMVSRSSENGWNQIGNTRRTGRNLYEAISQYLMMNKKRAQQTSAFCFSDDL